jgi:hypothetical protein
MLIADDPEAINPEDLLLELSVHQGVTKTVHRIRWCGKLVFVNRFNDVPLEIESEDSPPPFVVPGCAAPQSRFTVAAGHNLIVSVSEAYPVRSQFTYSAKLEGTTAEDPIVVVDRR